MCCIYGELIIYRRVQVMRVTVLYSNWGVQILDATELESR